MITSILIALVLVSGPTAPLAFAQDPEIANTAVTAQADTAPQGLPLYELGIGLGAALFPHYPGASQSKLYIMPFPFAIYRGRFIQSDRKGMRARLFTGKTFDISVSGSGAFPVKSRENNARLGMPDLGWMGQGGPKLRMELGQWDDGGLLRFGFSLRTVVASENIPDLNHRGTVYEPEIVYTRPDVIGDWADLYTSIRTTFASRGVNSYFYHVPPEFVTADRPAYNAKAGLLESTATVGLSFNSPDQRHRWFISFDASTLEGAANLDSSLIRSRVNSAVAAAWIWTFFDSKEKAIILY